jgi:hypothetical protein
VSTSRTAEALETLRSVPARASRTLVETFAAMPGSVSAANSTLPVRRPANTMCVA